MNDSKTVRTMCPMNCHPTLCGMKVTVAGGVVTRIEGDEDNPDSRGFLCGRGRAAGEIIGNHLRITRPRIRVERGRDEWREVTWGEAMDHIAEVVGRIQPHEFGIWLGHGELATNYGTRLGGQLAKRFAHMWGAQWWHPAIICWALGGFGLGLTGVLQVNTKEDTSTHADLVLLWGANIASQPNTAPHLKAARARGARVVTVDVREAEAAARADEVVRIRPGTDAALALAMMHVIVRDGLQDNAFVSEHTLGFEALREHITQFTPAWAEDVTGVGAVDIERLATEYATTRRAVIIMGGSSMHKHQHGWESARAISCLAGLTGKLGIEGGGLGERHGGNTFGQGLNPLVPDGKDNCTHPVPTQMPAMLEAFADGRVKALLTSGTNMMSSFADTHALSQALDKLELVVCHDLFSNDTIREHADVVLPGTAWLEQVGCKMTHTHLYWMEQALEAPQECGSFTQLMRDLASRLGLDNFFPWRDDEDMINAVINHPSTGGATVAALRENPVRALNVSTFAYPDHHFDTPSGKVEFQSARAREFGLSELPTYTPPERSAPLAFRQGRTLNHFHGFYDHGQALPTLRKRGGSPTLWLNVNDASARKISDGDAIRIFNQRGSFRATAYVTDRIGAGCVWMRDGWRGINELTSGERVLPDASVDIFNFGAGQSAYEARVEVELAAP